MGATPSDLTARQLNRKRCSSARRAVQQQRAAVASGYDVVAEAEAESGTRPCGFRRVERFEDTRLRVQRNPGAII